MRTVAFALLLATSVSVAGQVTLDSRLGLPLTERLDAPLNVASASVRLSDFVNFIATAYKIPLLVEAISPVPDVRIPAGTFTARQLLDLAVRQMRGYKWQSENGVAHIFQSQLVAASGNLLNVTIHRYYFPATVADFDRKFRYCVHATFEGYDCYGFVGSGFVPAELTGEQLPYLEAFRDVTARAILLKALAANGHFYVLIAYESTRPKQASDFSFLNWFTRSLVPDEPTPMYIQYPKRDRTR